MPPISILLHPFQELEMLMKTHGIVHPRLDGSAQLLTDVFAQPELQFLKSEQSLVAATMALEADLLDESLPVSGDPMLSTLNSQDVYVNSQRNNDIIDLLKMNVSCQWCFTFYSFVARYVLFAVEE